MSREIGTIVSISFKIGVRWACTEQTGAIVPIHGPRLILAEKQAKAHEDCKNLHPVIAPEEREAAAFGMSGCFEQLFGEDGVGALPGGAGFQEGDLGRNKPRAATKRGPRGLGKEWARARRTSRSTAAGCRLRKSRAT